MPGLVPNRLDVAFAAQADIDTLDLEIFALAHRRYGVLSGCLVSAQGTPNATVAVAAGTALVGGRKVTVAAGNVTIAAGDATNPRFDLVVIDNTGAKSVVQGTATAYNPPSTTPVFPTLPGVRTVLAAIYVPAGDTAIDANQIVDKRVVVPEPVAYFSSDYGVLGDGTTDNTTNLQAWIDAGRISFHDVTGPCLTGQLEARNGSVIRGISGGGYNQGDIDQMIPEGQRSCLRMRPTTPGHIINGAVGVGYVTIEHIELDGNRTALAAGTYRGINLPDAGAAEEAQWSMFRVYIHDTKSDGAYFGNNRQAYSMSHCVVYQTDNNGVVMNGSDGRLERCIIGWLSGSGVYVGAWVQHIDSNDIFTCWEGITVAGGVSDVEITGNGIDRHNSHGINIGAGAATEAISVIANLFHSNGQSTNNTYSDIYVQTTSGAVSVAGNNFGPLDTGQPNKVKHCIELVAGATVSESGNSVAKGHHGTSFMNYFMRNGTVDIGSQAQVAKNPGATTVSTFGLAAAPTLAVTLVTDDAADGPWLRHDTAATLNSDSGVLSAFTITRRDWEPQLDMTVKTPATLTSIRLQAGWFSADPAAAPTNIHSAFFRYDTGADGTAFWRCCTAAGVAPTVTVTDVAVVADRAYQFSIVMTAGAVLFFINRFLVAVHTANLPGPTTLLGYGIRVRTLVAAARSVRWGRVNMSRV